MRHSRFAPSLPFLPPAVGGKVAAGRMGAIGALFLCAALLGACGPDRREDPGIQRISVTATSNATTLVVLEHNQPQSTEVQSFYGALSKSVELSAGEHAFILRSPTGLMRLTIETETDRFQLTRGACTSLTLYVAPPDPAQASDSTGPRC